MKKDVNFLELVKAMGKQYPIMDGAYIIVFNLYTLFGLHSLNIPLGDF